MEVRFGNYAGLWVRGTLKAMGTAAQPITFTSALTTPTPGAWRGLTVDASSASAQLDYVTVEYGGDGRPGSVYVYYGGQASISHSKLIYSSSAGLYAGSGGTGREHRVQPDRQQHRLRGLERRSRRCRDGRQ